MMSSAPACANAVAIALPSPLLPPVTNATRPVKSKIVPFMGSSKQKQDVSHTGSNSYLRIRFVKRSTFSRRVNMRWSANLNWYQASPSYSFGWTSPIGPGKNPSSDAAQATANPWVNIEAA
jgi:hypothetical protein